MLLPPVNTRGESIQSTYLGTGVGLEGLGRRRISLERLVLQEASRDSTDYK